MDTEQEQSLIQTFIDGVQQGITLFLNITFTNPDPQVRAFFWFVLIAIITISILNLIIAKWRKGKRK